MSEGAITMPKLSNIEVAGLIGLSHVQVSRIRSGHRLPGIETMMAICKEFDWSMDEQSAARLQGLYAPKFEEALARYASDRKTETGPGERHPGP
jgi:transcriptional regulator with XRE-family HTH domain